MRCETAAGILIQLAAGWLLMTATETIVITMTCQEEEVERHETLIFDARHIDMLSCKLHSMTFDT